MHHVPGEPLLPLRHPAGPFKFNYEELKAAEKSQRGQKRPFSSVEDAADIVLVNGKKPATNGTKETATAAVAEIVLTA